MQPDYKIPYSKNIAVGMTRELGPFSARLDYVHTQDRRREHRARHQLGAERQTARIARRDPRYGNITLVGNGGSIWYNGLETRVELRPSANGRAGLSYTLSKTRSNTSTGLSTGGTTNPFNLNEDLGPDDNDRRHNFVLDGSYLDAEDRRAAGRHHHLSQCGSLQRQHQLAARCRSVHGSARAAQLAPRRPRRAPICA